MPSNTGQSTSVGCAALLILGLDIGLGEECHGL